MPTGRKIFLVAVAIFVLIVIGSFFVPIYGEICTEKGNAKDCASYHIALVFFWRSVKTLDTWNSLITAIATVAIGFFTWAIRSINQKQWTHAREVERAYLSGGGPVRFDEDRRVMVFVLTVENTGKTPATLVD